MPFYRTLILVFLLLATACSRAPDVETSASTEAMEAPAPAVQRKPQAEIDWSPVRLEAGDAWVDCGADYRQGDGRPVLSLAYIDLRGAMQDCRSTGLLRLRYKGRMTASFAALAERAGKVAGDLGIGKRILDIDSGGGSVESAMRAGDAIGENDWTIWVRADSVCHSACVLLLAAGDMRVIVGPVGIHRMIRLRSTATSRKELGEELRRIRDDLPNYLGRGGPHLHDLAVLDAGDGARLAVSFAMVASGTTIEDRQARPPETLVPDLAQARFRYRGLGEDGLLGEWTDSWEQVDTLPLQVSVELASRSGGSWPPLVVMLPQRMGGVVP